MSVIIRPPIPALGQYLLTACEAKLRLVSSPPSRSLVVLGYPDIYTAADHVPEILASKPR